MPYCSDLEGATYRNKTHTYATDKLWVIMHMEYPCS